jgi:surface polysaccharide O-acyltransferase-like enzyme
MKRYIALDYLKLIMAFLVITIHVPIFTQAPLLWFEISHGIARVAVPIFFIINGFFFQPLLNNSDKVKKYLLHLCLIYVVWQIIYLPFSFDPNPKYILVTILFGFRHLWYVPALIGGTILLYFFHKNKINDKHLLFLAIVLYLLGDILMRMVPFQLFGITLIFKYIRSFLFFGFPFIFIGYYIRKYKQDKIVGYDSIKLFLLTAVLLIAFLVEAYFAYTQILPGNYQDFYILLLPLCPLIFVCTLKISKLDESHGYVNKLASSIYFIQFVVIYLLERLSFTNTSLYIMTAFLSVLLSACVVEINKRWKIFL